MTYDAKDPTAILGAGSVIQQCDDFDVALVRDNEMMRFALMFDIQCRVGQVSSVSSHVSRISRAVEQCRHVFFWKRQTCGCNCVLEARNFSQPL